MVLNPFFQQGSSGEQNLVQSLINEQLKIYGIEIVYLPRIYATTKKVIKEVVESKFNEAYPLEAYVDNYEGYDDNTSILSKFGIQQTNEIKLIISQDRWETYVAPLIKSGILFTESTELGGRPKEGDLIYFPLGDRLFEIKYVEHDKPFYQLQKNYVYTLTCELFRYGNEIIDTGIDEIDDELVGDELTGVDYDDTVSFTHLGMIQTLLVVGTGSTAEATTTFIESGSVRYVTVTNRGSGYIGVPDVGFSSSPGTTAVGISSMIYGIAVCNDNSSGNQGSIQSVDLINPGAGYTVTPKISFSGAKYVTAGVATAIDGFRTIGIVTVTDAGSGFATAPDVTFSTPIHVGAAATAILATPMVALGVSVTSAVISIGASNYLFPGGTTGGAFYDKAPYVKFSLPDVAQTDATATAVMGDYATTGGTVASITINDVGTYYADPPSVTITAPTSSVAIATIGIVDERIDPTSIAFSTTGRAYTTAPTVAITTSGFITVPTQTAVGIATIDPITGIVTAVSFDPSDPWAVGSGATVGAGYTQAPVIAFSGSTGAVGASATAIISGIGTLTSIAIGNSGYGYANGEVPTVTIGSAGTNSPFRATGIATIRFNSLDYQGTVGIGSTTITGISTDNVIVGDRVRLESGYDAIWNFIPEDTFVTSIGSSTLVLNNAATNVGIATSVFEIGINSCGIVTGIIMTYGGGGYANPPTIEIQNDVSVSNYHEVVAGVHTAKGYAVLDSSGKVDSIRITDAGAKYVIGTGTTNITLTIADPPQLGIGTDFSFNEIVTGETSGATARVRAWDKNVNFLELGNVAGTFINGETITGGSSGATQVIRNVGRLDTGIDDDPLDEHFADNKAIEDEADKILDFTEENPFGTP